MRKRMDPAVLKELDNKLAAMTEKQRDELSREGARLQVKKPTEAEKEERAKYQRMYRARIALAHRLGVIKK